MNVYRVALVASIAMTRPEVTNMNQRDGIFPGITLYSLKEGTSAEAIFLAENDETARNFFGSDVLNISRVPAEYELVLTLERGSLDANGVFQPQELLGKKSGF